MNKEFIERLDAEMALLRADQNDRTLKNITIDRAHLLYEGRQYVNFSSNDYLGLADTDLQREFLDQFDLTHKFMMSNPSSRLVTGNTHYEALERTLGARYGASALVLGSGFLMNEGILSAVSGKGDLILADKLVHASLIDGLRLCDAEVARFRHNDMRHLEHLLEKAENRYRNLFIVTESVFSMDGDRAPLAELVALKRRFGALLYLDEAHAFGVMGDGLGLAAELGVLSEVDFLCVTFGKALVSHGAAVVCNPRIRNYLINRMRSLIFSTALPPLTLEWSRFLIERFERFAPQRTRLIEMRRRFADELDCEPFASHILPFIVGENHAAIALSRALQEAGFWVSPIRYPTVPQGTARLRVSLDAALSDEEVSRFILTLKELWKNIG